MTAFEPEIKNFFNKIQAGSPPFAGGAGKMDWFF